MTESKGQYKKTQPNATVPSVQQVTYDEPIHAVVVEPSPNGTYPEASYQQAPPPSNRQGGGSSFEFYLCGSTAIRRMSETTHISVGLCGSTYMDMRDAQFPPGSKVTIFAARLCGNTDLLVPPGTHVIVRRFLLCGTKDVYVEPQTPEGSMAPPSVTITILSLCGKVLVRSDPDEMPRKFCRKLRM